MVEATRTDFEVPARYGVAQTIGDTLGIGGIFRALRTFPFLKALGDDMAEVCPDAWLLNYINPMAMNVEYLSRATGLRRVVGLCHSVHWTVHDLCELVRAAVENEPRHIRHAAMVDPATSSALRVEQIWQLCDDMVLAHADRLQPGLRATLGS